METDNSTVSYTKAHIENVKAKMSFFASVLAMRGENHDKSKLLEPEVYGWMTMDREPKYPYGSKEYYDKMHRYNEVIQHHYAVNSHHPEHFSDPNTQMDLIDLIEMLCDWFSYKGEISWLDGYNRILQQCERFHLDNTIKSLLLNTFRHFLVKSSSDAEDIAVASEKIVADTILSKVITKKGWDNLNSDETIKEEQWLQSEEFLDSLLSKQHFIIESLKNFRYQ